MSIELPFGNTSQAHRCPLCGLKCRVHPITDRSAPGGYSRQVSCANYGSGCEYSEPIEAAQRAARLMVAADNLAVLAEHAALPDQRGEWVMPAYLTRHMASRKRGA